MSARNYCVVGLKLAGIRVFFNSMGQSRLASMQNGWAVMHAQKRGRDGDGTGRDRLRPLSGR